MTPFVPVTDGAQVELVFDLGGEIVQNRLWFVSRQPPVDSSQLLALAQGVYDWYTSQVLVSLSSSLQLAVVEALDWSADPSPDIEVAGTPINGSGSAECHSANVADRIWFYSSLNLTRIRNSNFVPGIPKDVVSLNTVDQAFRSNVGDAYINLIDLASGFGPFPAWRWVCASSWDSGALRTTQRVLRTDFIRYLRPTVAQRRRRLPPYPS